MSEVIAVHAIVSGYVQGVGYRQACRFAARGHGLHGWVRNRFDGTVEVLLQGETDAVDKMLDWLWIGPPAAEVSGVVSNPAPTESNLGDFFIAR